jgi:hypothetical protein
MAHRFYGTTEKVCEACGRPFMAKTKRTRYCDEAVCASARETEYKRRMKARKEATA